LQDVDKLFLDEIHQGHNFELLKLSDDATGVQDAGAEGKRGEKDARGDLCLLECSG
jgi:hypothetical protein